MLRPTFPARSRRLLFLAAAALTLGGCGDGGRLSPGAETDEPSYREGDSLMRAGRRQEALTAFLKVIDKRGDDAPESHLNAGLIYQQHINDPLSAIYHFKKYLALRPNSPQTPLVRQRIDAAIREFARTLPAQPLEGAPERVDLVAALDRMKQENDQLKQQIADLKAGREVADSPVPEPSGQVPTVAAPPPDPNRFNLTFESIPTVRMRPARPEPAPASGASAPASAPAKNSGAAARRESSPVPATPAHGAARRHVVQRGDTLSNLAQKYFGNRARWHDIYNANRKIMKNESDLRVGMDLVIPP